jgi:hypothetical protein
MKDIDHDIQSQHRTVCGPDHCTVGRSAAGKTGVKAFLISLTLIVIAMVLVAINAVGNFHG